MLSAAAYFLNAKNFDRTPRAAGPAFVAMMSLAVPGAVVDARAGMPASAHDCTFFQRNAIRLEN